MYISSLSRKESHLNVTLHSNISKDKYLNRNPRHAHSQAGQGPPVAETGKSLSAVPPIGWGIASWSFPCACSRLELRCHRLVLCTTRSYLDHVPKPATTITIVLAKAPLATFWFALSHRFALVAGLPSVCRPRPGSSAQLTGTIDYVACGDPTRASPLTRTTRVCIAQRSP